MTIASITYAQNSSHPLERAQRTIDSSTTTAALFETLLTNPILNKERREQIEIFLAQNSQLSSDDVGKTTLTKSKDSISLIYRTHQLEIEIQHKKSNFIIKYKDKIILITKMDYDNAKAMESKLRTMIANQDNDLQSSIFNLVVSNAHANPTVDHVTNYAINKLIQVSHGVLDFLFQIETRCVKKALEVNMYAIALEMRSDDIDKLNKAELSQEQKNIEREMYCRTFAPDHASNLNKLVKDFALMNGSVDDCQRSLQKRFQYFFGEKHNCSDVAEMKSFCTHLRAYRTHCEEHQKATIPVRQRSKTKSQ